MNVINPQAAPRIEWHATSPARRNFAQAARAYVATMDAFTRAIEVVQGAANDNEALVMYRNANAARGQAFRALVEQAVALDAAHKASQANTNTSPAA